MESTTIRSENLNTLASKGDIQDLITTIVRIEQLILENNTKSSKLELLPLIWKFYPIIHTLLHFVTIFLVSGII